MLVHPHAQFISKVIPERLPTENDFKQAVVTAQSRLRLASNPLAAIQVLWERNPDSFLACEYLCENNGKNDIDSTALLESVICPRFGRQTAIRYALINGLYLDSAWRAMNAYHCPLTALVTRNDQGRMIPVAVLVSRHATTDVYRRFLQRVLEAIEAEAQAYLKDPNGGLYQSGTDAARMQQYCTEIEEDGFTPAFVMIDCDDAERSAVNLVWPGINIRVCQFHFMQAVRWQGLHLFGNSPEGRLKTRKLMSYIRKLQRCDMEDRWSEYYKIFKRNVLELAGSTRWEKIHKWLSREWFSERWRRSAVDYGLPHYWTRENPIATNNLIEAAFKTFIKVILNCKANRR